MNNDVDTSTKAAERRAKKCEEAGFKLHADFIRALVAERDNLKTSVLAAVKQVSEEGRLRGIAEAEKDRLAAENARLRETLNDLMTWFPDKPSPPEWRLPGGKYGADEAVAAARAALGDTP
jgi:hypothetical protein